MIPHLAVSLEFADFVQACLIWLCFWIITKYRLCLHSNWSASSYYCLFLCIYNVFVANNCVSQFCFAHPPVVQPTGKVNQSNKQMGTGVKDQFGEIRVLANLICLFENSAHVSLLSLHCMLYNTIWASCNTFVIRYRTGINNFLCVVQAPVSQNEFFTGLA